MALSPEAKLLASTMGAAMTAPDTRADKVRELKEQVQSGTYKPDLRRRQPAAARGELPEVAAGPMARLAAARLRQRQHPPPEHSLQPTGINKKAP